MTVRAANDADWPVVSAALLAGGAGLALIGLGSLAAPLAETWTMFVAARMIEASGLPFIVAAMPAIIQSHSAGPRRVLAMGIWSTWLPLGVAAAMALSLVTLDSIGWRGLFLICGMLPWLGFPALWLLVASRPQAEPARLSARPVTHIRPNRYYRAIRVAI